MNSEFYNDFRVKLDRFVHTYIKILRKNCNYNTIPAKNGFTDVPDDDFCLRIELQTATPVNR